MASNCDGYKVSWYKYGVFQWFELVDEIKIKLIDPPSSFAVQKE